MKTYVKPTVDVVELSVKENMAALPGVLTGNETINFGGAYGEIVTTVYDLTEVNVSQM